MAGRTCTGDYARVIEYRRVPCISFVASITGLRGRHVRRRHHRRGNARTSAVTAFAITWRTLENALYMTGFTTRLGVS